MLRDQIKLHHWCAADHKDPAPSSGKWWVGMSDFMVFERERSVYSCRRIDDNSSITCVYSGNVAAALSVAAAAGAWQTVYDIAARNFEVGR